MRCPQHRSVLVPSVACSRQWQGRREGFPDGSTEYGLTGAIFATDEAAILQADQALRYAAGNYYVNDKPTGAAVGHQPFGGARASGTERQAGTVWNLIRFVSPRAVKRTHVLDRNPSFPALDG